MSTKKTKASKKDRKLKQNAFESHNDASGNQQPITENISENVCEEIRTVVVTLEYYKNIQPIYKISDVRTYLKYMGNEIGESNPVAVTDDNELPIEESFELKIDINDPKQIDNLASNGLILNIVQSMGVLDTELYEQLQNSKNIKSLDNNLSGISLFSMYEMFTGDHLEFKDLLKSNKKKTKKNKDSPKNKNKKEVLESEAKNSSKTSTTKTKKRSVKSKKSTLSNDTKKSEETNVSLIKSDTYGTAVVDFVPLLHGLSSFTEAILIRPVKQAYQMMHTYKNAPKITVTLKLKEETPLIEAENIINLTIESVCNLPSLILDMDCRICCLLPLLDEGKVPTVLLNSKLNDTPPPEETFKRYPTVQDKFDESNKLKYIVSSDLSDVKNKLKVDLQDAFKEGAYRFEFNCIKRNIVYKKGLSELRSQFYNCRKMVLEILFTPKSKIRHQTLENLTESFNFKSSNPHLHLMALVDVTSFLYPGVTKLRIACPISTFNYEEANKFAELKDSYFLPTKKNDQDLIQPKIDKVKDDVDSPKKKADKSSKSTHKKDTASHSSNKIKEKDLKSKLPPKPNAQSDPEPSIEVYNENEKRTFVIIEIELLKPITPKRDIEELKSNLEDLQKEYIEDAPKIVLNSSLAKDFFSQTISEIIKDLNQAYSEIDFNNAQNNQKKVNEFAAALEKSGKYQSYLSSISTATSFIIANKYQFDENTIKNNKECKTLISEVYSFLMSETNKIINTYKGQGMTTLSKIKEQFRESLLIFVKEALALRNYVLAERYLVERIYLDQDESAHARFEYAMYFLETNNRDKAFETVKESLARKKDFKYAMLMLAVMLTDRDEIESAETYFLNILLQEPKWVEGWATIYLFYEKIGNEEGMDKALEMCQRYLEDPCDYDDLTKGEEFIWSSEFLPNTTFFKEAVLMLKLRLFRWVEKALAQEICENKHYGHVNYLMAVLSYYQQDYCHALNHIEEAKNELGVNHAVQSMIGHIYLATEKYEEAKEEYLRVIESYNRPDDIHLVYLSCALALEKLGDKETARELFLTSCKLNQTPYVWMSLGKLYYICDDLEKAEECFYQANIKDNSQPNIWAYLTLINLKKQRANEAEQCYQQANKGNIKNGEKDEELFRMMEEEYRKVVYGECITSDVVLPLL